MDILSKSNSRILVFGGGGGGDVVTAAFIALKLRQSGYKTFIGAAPWERFVIDPTPGPISLNEIYNAIKLGKYCLEINGDSYAVRNGRKIFFQAINVSRAINEPVFICELNKGVSGLYNGLVELTRYLEIDVIMGVDVGGDIIAKGNEKELWSPLADQITLSALYKIDKNNICKTIIALASIGSDGELPREYIINRLSLVASKGGLLGAFGFGHQDLKYIRRILSQVVTEAGRAILESITGFKGYKSIRKGSRVVYVDILSSIVFLLDTSVIYNLSLMADIISESKSIDEANEILLNMGIFTELELEKELMDIIKTGNNPDKKSILSIKERWLKRSRKI